MEEGWWKEEDNELLHLWCVLVPVEREVVDSLFSFQLKKEGRQIKEIFSKGFYLISISRDFYFKQIQHSGILV